MSDNEREPELQATLSTDPARPQQPALAIRRALGAIALALLAVVLSEGIAAADPVVPGFDVTVYATVTDPLRMSFDPSGAMYLGRDNSGSGGTSGDPVKIHRIEAGGLPVSEYGAAAIFDPDAVAFDATGTIGGAPGSVLVGSFAIISAIRPDQSVVPLFSGASLGNIGDMVFDGAGRLLFTSEDFRNVQVTTGGAPSVLFTIPAPIYDIDVDASGNIYTGAGDGVIRIHDAGGVLIDSAFASGLGAFPQFAIGHGGAFGNDVVVVTRTNGDLIRIDASGTKTVVGSGFISVSDLSFGSDQALYVDEFDNDRVLRIAPSVVGVPEATESRLVSAYPNPFSSNMTLSYALKLSGPISITLFDTSGRRVGSLLEAWKPAGRHSVDWDGRDSRGNEVAAGVYVVRVEPEGTKAQVVKLR